MSPRLRRSTLLYLMLTWLTLLAIASALLITVEIRRLEQQFQQASDALTVVVRNKLDTNEAVLSGLVAFLLAVEEDDREATQRYAAAMVSAYPHIHMIEIARRVPANEAADLVATLQRSWRSDFALKTFSELTGRKSVTEAPRGDTWPILFIYPALAEADPIYGLRLESVEHLAATLARAQASSHAVSSPVFQFYEGGMGYILLQSVERPAQAHEGGAPNLFGNTMAAMLVIRSEALLPATTKHTKTPMSITLGLIGNSGAESMLVSAQTVHGTRLEDWLLPVFERTERISTSGQKIDITFAQQQRLKDVLRPETVAIFALLFAAVLLAPWLLLRHYSALAQASIEHEQSAYLATHDVLTGVPNRYLLADHFKLAVRNWERNGARFALLLLDLDHFKDINDRFGHEAGDRVLCAAADRITAQLRSCDTVARYGGDEFIILLTNILDAQDAVQVGEKLLAAVSHPIATPGGSLTVSCSLGIAVCPDHGTDLDTLRRNADMAMYQAKQSGRCAVVVSAAQQG